MPRGGLILDNLALLRSRLGLAVGPQKLPGQLCIVSDVVEPDAGVAKRRNQLVRLVPAEPDGGDLAKVLTVVDGSEATHDLGLRRPGHVRQLTPVGVHVSTYHAPIVKKRNGTVASDGKQPRPCLVEVDGIELEAMTHEWLTVSSVVDPEIPLPDLTILRASEEGVAVRFHDDALDAVSMPVVDARRSWSIHLNHGSAVVDVKDPDLTVTTAGDEPACASVRDKLDAKDVAPVAGGEELAWCKVWRVRVPDPDGGVVAAGGEVPAVAGPVEGVDATLMTIELMTDVQALDQGGRAVEIAVVGSTREGSIVECPWIVHGWAMRIDS